MNVIRFTSRTIGYSCDTPGDHTGDYIKLEDATKNDNRRINWMVRYMLDENFGEKHLEALCYIVGLMNDSEESESEILEFARHTREKYAK